GPQPGPASGARGQAPLLLQVGDGHQASRAGRREVLAAVRGSLDTRRVQIEVLDYVVLIVSDLDRALGFYTGTLGLKLQHRAEKYAQMKAGTTRLSLYTRDAMAETLGIAIDAPSTTAPAFELGFKVSDCDAAFAELVGAGAPVVM